MDFENFLEPRPDFVSTMEKRLEPIVELLTKVKWPFRIHATYYEPIGRFLNVVEWKLSTIARRLDSMVTLNYLFTLVRQHIHMFSRNTKLNIID